ncbi:hypothetical protein K439DRAFT_411863 [Ramaria rubella]|nr:hypothetical protein K439DRAFT_411863 [Ramaria rubella]
MLIVQWSIVKVRVWVLVAVQMCIADWVLWVIPLAEDDIMHKTALPKSQYRAPYLSLCSAHTLPQHRIHSPSSRPHRCTVTVTLDQTMSIPNLFQGLRYPSISTALPTIIEEPNGGNNRMDRQVSTHTT